MSVKDLNDTPEDPFASTSDVDPPYSVTLSDDNTSSSYDGKCQTSKKKKQLKLVDLFRRNKNDKNVAAKMDTYDDLQVGTEKTKTVSILDGKYFKVSKIDGNFVDATCQLCLPQLKKIKGRVDSSSNFVRHIKRLHPEKLKDYNSHKQSKKDSRLRKRSRTENEDLSSFPSTSKQHRMMQPTLQGTLARCIEKTVVPQTAFEERVLNFVLSTMSALSIIEHWSFLALFQGMNVKVPTRKTIMKKINEIHEINMCEIKDKIRTIDFLCTTADIWSNKKRSFLGVTIHWIEDNFVRGSAAIACKRFKGTHSYRNIAEFLEDINLKFGLTENKVVGTVTDNGSNFVKAFKEYAVKDNSTEDEDIAEGPQDTFSAVNIEVEEAEQENIGSTELFTLPKHIRCASHTLNLIGTTDYKNMLRKNSVLRTRGTNAFTKCSLLWKKSNRPKSNEIVQKILGHTLSSPGVTRWNSTYDSVSQIIKEKDQLPILSEKLGLEPFKETEVLYLEEYCSVMKPLADTLDFLQGESNTFFGFLLPSLISLGNKYEKMIAAEKYKYGGDQLAQMCLNNLQKRFSNILHLNCKEAVIATVLLPQFKLRWYSIVKDPSLSIEAIKKEIIQAAKDLIDGNADESDESDTKNFDEFFDFSEDRTVLNMDTTNDTSSKISKIELELLRYLDDRKTHIHTLNEYPTLKKLSIKFNTCLPSSGPVERLFSFATIIDDPRRNALTDENFEILVLSKANKK